MFQLFATPMEGDFLGLAEALSCHQFALLIRAADQRADQVGQARGGIAADAVCPDVLSTRPWSPELGACRLALAGATTPQGVARLNAQLAIAAFLTGLTAEISISYDAEAPLCVSGRVVQGPELRIRGAAGCLSVDGVGLGPNGIGLTRQVSDTGAFVWLWEAEADLVKFGGGALGCLATPTWMDNWTGGGELPEAVADSPADRKAAIRALEDALAMIEAADPHAYLWIVALLREITPLAAHTGGTRSASFIMWPGHLQISRAGPVDTLVMLLHECSHQYFHLALWCGPVAAPDAPRVHSVLKGVERPLDKLLLGLHAFGNVLLALERIGAFLDGPDLAARDRQIDHTRRLVRGLFAALAPHCEAHLTASGHALFTPLHARLAAADYI